MNIKEVTGIDISKETLDCCIHTFKTHGSFANTKEGIDEMVGWAISCCGISRENGKEILFVFEHTGLYTHSLIKELSCQGLAFAVVAALEIKRSLGITRGKNDKVDALRIARYGYLLREEIQPTPVHNEALGHLQRLTSMRRKLVAQRAGHKATLNEQERVLEKEDHKVLFEVQREIVATLDRQVERIEKEIVQVIENDAMIKEQYSLLLSVRGIGPVTARFLIIHTKGFTAFSTWRKFASYCGIAPFTYTSGTSIRGKTRISHLANKEGKTLLTLCAASSIQHNAEMKGYYNKRINEGKHEMSTLNIIRNKILARAFAVIGRGTPYVNTMKYAA